MLKQQKETTTLGCEARDRGGHIPQPLEATKRNYNQARRARPAERSRRLQMKQQKETTTYEPSPDAAPPAAPSEPSAEATKRNYNIAVYLYNVYSQPQEKQQKETTTERDVLTRKSPNLVKKKQQKETTTPTPGRDLSAS